MKNHELIEAYGKNPFAKLMSSQYRAMEGILFVRHILHNVTQGWRPLAIFDENVSIRWNKFIRPASLGSRTEQAYWGMETFKDKSRPNVTIDQFPDSCILPPNLKRIPNRREMIRMAINESVFPSEWFEPQIVEPMRKLMWEWALTRSARTITTARKEVETGMNQLSTSNDFQKLAELFEDAKSQTHRNDMTSAYETVSSLYSTVQKCAEKSARIRTSIDVAKSKTKSCFIPSNLHFFRNGEVSPKYKSTHENSCRNTTQYSSNKRLIIEAEDLIVAWKSFSEFLVRIGVDVPKPFGLEFNNENISKLSACWETAVETLIDPSEYLNAECKPQEILAAASSSNSNLFLG